MPGDRALVEQRVADRRASGRPRAGGAGSARRRTRAARMSGPSAASRWSKRVRDSVISSSTGPSNWTTSRSPRRSTSQARARRARQRRRRRTRHEPVIRRCEWIVRSPSKRRNRCLPWASTARHRAAGQALGPAVAARSAGAACAISSGTWPSSTGPDAVRRVVDRVALGHLVPGYGGRDRSAQSWPPIGRWTMRIGSAPLAARQVQSLSLLAMLVARRLVARDGPAAPDRDARARERRAADARVIGQLGVAPQLDARGARAAAVAAAARRSSTRALRRRRPRRRPARARQALRLPTGGSSTPTGATLIGAAAASTDFRARARGRARLRGRARRRRPPAAGRARCSRSTCRCG